MILLCAFVSEVQARDEYTVRIGNYSFVPPPNNGQVLAKKTRDARSVLPDGQHPVLLQFYELPSQSQRASLAAHGIRLYDYLGGRAYFATVGKGFWKGAAREEAVRSIMPIEARWKVSPLLEEGSIPEYAMAMRGNVDVNVIYHERVDEAFVRGVLQRQAVQVERVSAEFRTVSLTLPMGALARLAEEPWVVAIHPRPAPAELENYRGRVMNGSHILSQPSGLGGRGLTGAGVRVGVFDGDVEHHVDFGDRVHVQENEMAVVSNGGHGVHVTGTLSGAGILDPLARGVAPGVELYTYNFAKMSNGLPVSEKMLEASRRFHANITQNSYGVAIGKYCVNYNKFSYNGMEVSWDVDFVAQLEPTLLHVYSVGNDRESKDNCGHAYGSSAKRSKNAVYVGAIDANGKMSSYSSWGPMDDGRILPTVVALGTKVYSTRPDNTYGEGTGSSMACPSVSGVAALLTERYRQLNQGVLPLSALLRGVIANTASDRGPLGPDYQNGYGLVDASRAVKTIEKGWYFVGDFHAGSSPATHTINVPSGVKELRVMLVWNDTVSNKVYAYGEPALINDLDLEVVKEGVTTLPWVLKPSNPEADATRGVDRINNMEQVTIEKPAAGSYELKVKPTKIASNRQQYVLVYWMESEPPAVVYPLAGEQLAPGDRVYIRWEGLEAPVKVQVSVDNEKSYETIAEKVAGTQLEWNIPATMPATSEARVRLIAANGTIKNEQPFSIIGVPQNVSISAEECSVDSWKLRWDKVKDVEEYEVLKADVGAGEYKVIATVQTDNAEVSCDMNTLGKRNVYSVRAKLPSGSVGRRARAVIMASSVPLVLTRDKIPFVENFEKCPSPYVQLIGGRNMTMGYISSYPGITVRPGHHLVTSYGARGKRADDWDADDVFSTVGNKNRLKMCGVDLRNVGYSALHLTLRITQMYFHRRQNSSARVLINGSVVKDLNGVEVIQAVESQSTDVKTLCYDLTSYIGQIVNIEVQHVAKDVGCMMVVESIRIAPPEASGRIELTDLTTNGLVAGDSPRNDVTVEVLNGQPTKVDALALSYSIDGGPAVVESITDLKPYERRRYTFLTRADLSSKEELGRVFQFTAKVLHPDTLHATSHFQAVNTGVVYPLAYSPWDNVPFVGMVYNDPRLTKTVEGKLVFTPHRGAHFGYDANQRSTVRFKPSDASKKLRVLFKRFDTEKGADGFYVYNREVPEDLNLENVQYTDLLTGTLTDYELLACTKGGDITFLFSSDVSGFGQGWLAYITEESPENRFTLGPITLESHYADQRAPIVIKVRNNTDVEQRDVRVAYNVNGSTIWDVETIARIDAHGEISYTFPTPADVPFGGHYDIKVRIMSQDYDTSDNEVEASMINDIYCHDVVIKDYSSLYIKEVEASDGSKVSLAPGDGRIGYYLNSPMPIYGGSPVTQFTLHAQRALGNGDAAVLYIDWNADGTFDAATERYDSYTVLAATAFRFSIGVPASAVAGETRMRMVVGPSDAIASACPTGELAYGDVKDFKVKIVGEPFPVRDVAITGIKVKSGRDLSAEEPVTITLRNYGAEEITALEITLSVNGVESKEVAAIKVPAFNAEEVTYTLQRKLDLRAAGGYEVRVWIPDDQNPANNEVSATSYSVAPSDPDAFYALRFRREAIPAEGINLGTLHNTSMFARNGKRDATFEAWIMPQEDGRNEIFNGKNIVIFANTGAGAAQEYPRNSLVLQFVAASDRPAMVVHTGAEVIKPNQWQHVAVVLHLKEADAVDNFRVYVNGTRKDVEIIGGSFRCYAEENGEMPVLAGAGFGGMIRQIRCWNVLLSEGELAQREHMYATLRNGNGELPKGLLAEFNFAEGPGSTATVSGADVAVIKSGRLGNVSDPVWVSPTTLVTDVQLEGQIAPAEYTSPNHFLIPVAKDVELSKIKGNILAAWPGTQLKCKGKPIQEGEELDFSQLGNAISIEATVAPEYIFGQKIPSQTYTIAVKKLEPLSLLSITASKVNNPNLSADVTVVGAAEMRLNLRGMTDFSKVNLSFAVSSESTLTANCATIVSGGNAIDLRRPVELVLTSADGRQTKRYMLEALTSQKIDWAPIGAMYTYGDAPLTVRASSSSGLPIVYTSSNCNVATVKDGQLYITGVGEATLYAMQLGGKGWAPAERQQYSIQVKPKAITVAPKDISVEELHELPDMGFIFEGLVREEHAGTMQKPLYRVFVDGRPWEKHEALIPIGVHALKPEDATPYHSGNYIVTPKDGKLQVNAAAAARRITLHVVGEENKDVVGAVIRINHDAYTTDGGGLAFVRLLPGSYAYSTEAKGYIAAQEKLTVAAKDFKHEIRLQQPQIDLLYSVAEAKQGMLLGKAVQKVAKGGNGEPVYAVANAGYVFAGWSDGNASNPRIDINVTEKRDVKANFKAISFDVVYAVEGHGKIEGVARQSVLFGARTEPVKAVPDDGYLFVRWSDNFQHPERSDVGLTDNATYTAIFDRQPVLPYSQNFDGSLELPNFWSTVDESREDFPWRVSGAQVSFLSALAGNSVFGYASTNASLYSPSFSMQGCAGADVVVKFQYQGFPYPAGLTAKVQYKTDKAGWTDMAALVLDISIRDFEDTIHWVAIADASSLQLRWIFQNGDIEGYPLVVDNVDIRPVFKKTVEPTATLAFVVTGEAGALQGASVVVEGIGKKSTDPQGKAQFDGLELREYSYTVSMSGYATVEGRKTLEAGGGEVAVTLRKEATTVDHMLLSRVILTPNPVKEGLRVDGTSAVQRVSVVSLRGEFLLSQDNATGESAMVMKLDGLAEGMYILMVERNGAQRAIPFCVVR